MRRRVPISDQTDRVRRARLPDRRTRSSSGSSSASGMQLVPRFPKSLGLGALVPGRGLVGAGEQPEAEADRAIDLLHVGVVDLVPVIADVVIVRIQEGRADG